MSSNVTPLTPLGNQERLLAQAVIKSNTDSRNDQILKNSSTRNHVSKIKISNINFMAPDFSRPLEWDNDIIEFDIEFANIQVNAMLYDKSNDALTSSHNIPLHIDIELSRRPPQDEYSEPSPITTKQIRLIYIKNSNSKDSNRVVIYRNEYSSTISSHLIPSAPKQRTSVASLIRKDELDIRGKAGPATSDKFFRNGRNFINRGRATENGPDKDKENPHPRKLLLSGGVEVIEARVLVNSFIIGSEDQTKLTDKILIRSPADVFYYSGHGHSNLSTEFPGYLASVSPKVSPEQILTNWKKNENVKAFIIAGCSVLGIHPLTTEGNMDSKRKRMGVGMRWSRLLKSKGGPVEHLCGYWGSGPSDKNGGNDIAKRMGIEVEKNIKSDLARSWVKIHYDKFIDEQWDVNSNAAGLTLNTFYYLEYTGINRIEQEKIDPEQ